MLRNIEPEPHLNPISLFFSKLHPKELVHPKYFNKLKNFRKISKAKQSKPKGLSPNWDKDTKFMSNMNFH